MYNKKINKKENIELENVYNTIIKYYLEQNTKNNKKTLKSFITTIEKKIIFTILDITNGNQKNAADILNIRATTLNEKLKKYGKIYYEYKPDYNLKIQNKINLMKNESI